MDTTREYIEMAHKSYKLQDTQRYNYFDPKSKCNAHILRRTSYYAVIDENYSGKYYYVSNFATDYIHNSAVDGFISKPEDIFGCAVREGFPIVFRNEQVIWLPQQDELQAIMLLEVSSFRELSFWFNQWLSGLDWQKYFKTLTSMEQLWLAFVMYHKYDMVWDNELKEWN